MREAKELKKIKKWRNGITLIALVITIIVLLILAGVSITMLTGDNSILKQAANAKESTIEGQEKEAINVAYHGVLATNLGSVEEGEIFQEKLQAELTKNGQKATVSNNGKTITYDNGHVYTLNIKSGKIEAKDTKNKVTLADLYESGELKIGDYVNYNPTDGATQATETSNGTDNGYADQQFVLANYTGQWRVLGVENRQVILIATNNVGSEGEDFRLEKNGHTYKKYYLKSRIGYPNAVSELKKVCQLYGQGEYADKAKTRNVNVDDINKITGYNPNCVGVKHPTDAQIASGTKYSINQWNEYGNKVTYKFKGATSIYASSTNGKTNTHNYEDTTSYYNTFWWNNNGWKSITNAGAEETNIATIESTSYYYFAETLTNNRDTNATTGIAHNSVEYDMLFGTDEYDDAQYQGYWLGSQSVTTLRRQCILRLTFCLRRPCNKHRFN